MQHQSVAALHVADEDFLVASLIERCPKTMMVRELVMNALEAAVKSDGDRLVEVSAAQVDGSPKLCIWNSGPGMDAGELVRICDIAASIGKEKSLGGNFGMGAKVASLPSNQIGMRYRSCKSGRVHEVILCKRDGVYGRLRRRDPETHDYFEVVDVTDIAEGEGRPLDCDWTEVVLFGNREKQNTVADPYDGDPAQDAQWLATYLYHRFYRLPDRLRLVMRTGTHKLDGNRQFLTIPARSAFFEKTDAIECGDGIKAHFLYDAPYDRASGSGHNKSISGALASAVSTCAVIYKNEMYDVKRGRSWSFDAPIFGIPFGAKHISVHIELPDDYAVVPDAYRQFLRYSGGEQPHVAVNDFADLVRENRPDWLIELIRSLAPDSATSDDIRNELQRLLNQLRVRKVTPRVAPAGALIVAPGPGAASDQVASSNGAVANGADGRLPRATDLSLVPAGAKRAELYKNLERAPEIIPLRDEDEIEEKGLKGRAARYVIATGQLFVNMQYQAINEMRAQLESEYAGAPDVELMRSMVKDASEHATILRTGRTVVYALAKQMSKEWDQKAVEIACCPESLSMAADDYLDSLQNVRRALGIKMRVSRVEAATA